jgi:hypothetical protein
MVQIIQSGPTQATLRQQAMNEALDKTLGVFSDMEKTKRQQALQDQQAAFQKAELNMKLKEAGYDMSAQDAIDYASGKFQPRVVGEVRGAELQGPVMPGQGPLRELLGTGKTVSSPYEMRTQEWYEKEKERKANISRENRARELQEQAQKSQIRRNEFEMGQAAAMAPTKQQEVLADIALKNSQVAKNNYEASGLNDQIPGFRKVAAGKATDKDKETLKSMNATTLNVQKTANNLIDKITTNGITSGLGITVADKQVTQDLKDLQIQMKNLFDLGVLNGPDVDILNDALGSIQGPVDMLNPFNTREAAKAQVETVINNAFDKLKNIAASRGYQYDESQRVASKKAPSRDGTASAGGGGTPWKKYGGKE